MTFCGPVIQRVGRCHVCYSWLRRAQSGTCSSLRVGRQERGFKSRQGLTTWEVR